MLKQLLSFLFNKRVVSFDFDHHAKAMAYVFECSITNKTVAFHEIEKKHLTPLIDYLGNRWVLVTDKTISPDFRSFLKGYNESDASILYAIVNPEKMNNREFEYLWWCAIHDVLKID